MQVIWSRVRSAKIISGILALILLVVLASQYYLHFDSFQLRDQYGRTTSVTLPLLEHTWGPGVYTLEGDVHRGWFGPTTWKIVPDDQLFRLEINRREVDLGGIPAHKLGDVEHGFVIDLGQYLQSGANRVRFHFHDSGIHGSNMGMSAAPSLADWRLVSLILMAGLLVAGVLFETLRQRGVPLHHCLLYCLVLMGSIIQVWYIFAYNPLQHLWSDPGRHWEHGVDVLRNDLMTMTDPIFYQMYVSLLAKFTLKIPALVAYCTSILALLTPWLWYRFLRELQTSKTLALTGWAVISLMPSWTTIYAYFMQETLMLPLLGAALWATWRCRRKGTVGSFSWMIVFWIAAGLTRGVVIPMAAVCCTWLWLCQDDRLRKFLCSSAILLLIMGPLTYRSYQTVGHFAPVGMTHFNILYAQSGKQIVTIETFRQGGDWEHGFGSPSTGARPFAPFSDWKTRRSGTIALSIDLDKGREDWDAAYDEVDMTWRDYLWITGENLIFTFFSESWPNAEKSRFLEWLGYWMRWLWAPMFLLMVALIVSKRHTLRGQWLLPAMIAAWFVLQNLLPIAVNEGRYRKPLEGLMVAQLILSVAALKGQVRVPAPAPPLPAPLQAALVRTAQYLPRYRRSEREIERGGA